MRFTILFLLFLNVYTAMGQAVISGTLEDRHGQPIDNVSVSYKKLNGVALLGFARSAGDGSFTLDIKIKDADSVEVTFNHLNFKKKTIVLPVQTSSHRFTLEQGERRLEEVKVGNVPIFKSKDTINYNVDAFSDKNDRVIGDIVRKLPGIEVRDGTILYQGKPIQKYMVNNLDLMEGRYNMINNNLPADAVKSVQVVENDQPIKILDSLLFSDRASLNLELKKFTTAGTGKVSVGAKPLLWDIGITPMTFGKSFQMLASAQSNNVGRDATQDLRAFYTGGAIFGNSPEIGEGPSYISLQDISSPSLDETRWLDNKLFLFSANALQKLNSDVVLKGNVSYYDDTRERRGFTATQYYTSDEIVLSSEGIDNRLRANVLDAGLMLEKNEKEIYLRNTFKYHKRWNSDLGNLLLNDEMPIEQKKAYTSEYLANSLSFARFFGKQLVNVSSHLEWHRTPQNLSVWPGQFEDILNRGEPFEQMSQTVRYNRLQWKNNLGFVRKLGRWRMSPNVSINYDRNILDSYIDVYEDSSETRLTGDYRNAMRNSQLQLAGNLGLYWESKKWKFSLSTPFSVNYFNSEQHGDRKIDNLIRNTFQPSATLTHLLNGKNEWSVSLSGGNYFGKLDNFYDAYIVTQYRSIQRYEARVLGSKDLRASFSYRYKNPLKANFANFNYSYSRGSRDYTFANELDSLARINTTIINRNSFHENHGLSAGAARFIADVKTVMKINARANWMRTDYLLNGVMAKQDIFDIGGTLELINNFSSVISGDYKTILASRLSKLAGGRQSRTVFNNHFLNIRISPHQQHSILIQNSLYSNNVEGQGSQYFLDGTYRYHINKWKTDIELSVINLLNNDQYAQQYSTDYYLTQSYFELRPRQFLISTSFRF